MILALYLILYSSLRFMVEFLRIDSQPLLLDLRLAQVMAILVFIGGWIILFKNSFLKIKNQRSSL
ncbi:prolipoprotein diacylglyceryl transferase [Patescibacteria group bacterium]|nr:prolipoprotein diacylglyceryl transferase [Patescibacteria group bacterium]